MTKRRGSLLFIASTCLILLLAASFAIADEPKTPPEEAIFNTFMGLIKDSNDFIFSKYKDHKYLGKALDVDGSYVVFFGASYKGKESVIPPVRMYKLDSGIWIIGNVTFGYGPVK